MKQSGVEFAPVRGDGSIVRRGRRSRSGLAAALLALLLAWALQPASPAKTQSEPPVGFQLAAQVDAGGARCLALYGDFVVIGHYGALSVVDALQDPMPAVVGRLDLGTGLAVTGLAVVGTHAFFVTSDGRGLVADLRNPTDPQLVGRFEAPGDAFDPIALEVADGVAFLVTGSGSLFVYDIAIPEQPRLLGSTALTDGRTTVYDIDVAGDFVYLSVRTALLVIDARDLTAPVQVASLEKGGPQISWYGLLIDGEIGYVGGLSGGVAVLDMSEPASPKFLTQLPLPVIDSQSGLVREPVKLGNHLFYPAGERGFVSVDVSDPTQPRFVGSLALPGREISEAVADNGRVMAIDMQFGLHVIDASDPSDPELERSLEWPGVIVAVHVEGGIAYALSIHGRLLVYDVQEVYKPRKLAQFVLSYLASAVDMQIIEQRAYVLMVDRERPSQPRSYLQVVDLSEPARPVMGKQLFSSMNYADMSAACGHRLYLAGENGVALYELDGIGGAELRSTWIEGSATIRSLSCAEGWLYAIASPVEPEGLQLIAFDAQSSDSILPVSRQPLEDLRDPGTLFAFDSNLVVGTTDGITLFDIATPSTPRRRVTGLDTDFKLRHAGPMARQDSMLYVLGNSPDIAAIDLRDPAAPEARGYYFGSIGSNAVDVEGLTLVIGSGLSGITTFEITGLQLPSPSPTPSASPPPRPTTSAKVLLPMLVNRR